MMDWYVPAPVAPRTPAQNFGLPTVARLLGLILAALLLWPRLRGWVWVPHDFGLMVTLIVVAVCAWAAVNTYAWSPVVVAGLFEFIVFATAIWSGTRSYLWTPYADAHQWTADLFSAEASHRWLAYVWQPHTAQRIPIVRVLELLDKLVLVGRTPVFLMATILAQAIGTFAAVEVLRRTSVNEGLRLTVSAATVALTFGATTVECMVFPVFSVYIFVAGFALAALSCQELARQARRPGFLLASALAFAFLSSCANAAGLVVWPVLAVQALLWDGWRKATAIAGAGLAVIAAFEWGLGLPSQHLGALQHPLAHLLKMAVYFIGFLGQWWTSLIVPHASRAGGAIVLAAAAAGLWAVSRTPAKERTRLDRLGSALLVFGLMVAVMAAVGRVDELPEPIVPTRYFPFAALAQLGVVFIWAPRIAKRLPSRRTTSGILVCLGAVFLMHNIEGAHRQISASSIMRRSSADFDHGTTNPNIIARVLPDVKRAKEVRDQLKARGLPY